MPSFTSVTVSGAFVFASAVFASALSQNLPVVCLASKGSPPFSDITESIQYGVGTNASISFSLSTIMPSVGLWTRPTLKILLPPRFAAILMNLVREAPQTRSISCLASPAAARSKSTVVGFSNAAAISGLVIAENMARLTLTSLFALLTIS